VDEMKELEKLRLEFLKRGQAEETGAINRAKWALDYRGQAVVKVSLSDCNTFPISKDGANGHFQELPALTISVNLYATLEEIEKGVKQEVWGKIKDIIGSKDIKPSIRWLLDFDNPESTPPDFQAPAKGVRSPQTVIEEIALCLQAYDLSEEGKGCKEIARIIYPYEDSESESTKRKVHRKITKAKDLIKAAQQGNFPEKKE